MSETSCVSRTRGLLALAVVVGLGTPAAAQSFATLEAAAGQVVVVRQGQSLSVSAAMALQLNDIVVTKRGRASVRFASDGPVLRIGPDSRVQVNEIIKTIPGQFQAD